MELKLNVAEVEKTLINLANANIISTSGTPMFNRAIFYYKDGQLESALIYNANDRVPK